MGIREYAYDWNLGKKTEMGGLIGFCAGPTIGMVAAGIGGYELGTAINNSLGLTNHLGRATLDTILMYMSLYPGAVIGRYAGALTGAISGAVSHPVTKGIIYLNDKVRGNSKY